MCEINKVAISGYCSPGELLPMRRFVLSGICVLASGLMISTTGRSANLAVDQRTSRDPAMTFSAEVSKPTADDSLSYLLTPFQLTSQPNLKRSVFGFAGRTDSGNLDSTFVYGVGAPERIFYDNNIVGGAYQRDFFQFNSGLLIGAEVALLIASAITAFAVIPLFIRTAWCSRRSFGLAPLFEARALRYSMLSGFPRGWYSD
jgi:hypothetical protein